MNLKLDNLWKCTRANWKALGLWLFGTLISDHPPALCFWLWVQLPGRQNICLLRAPRLFWTTPWPVLNLTRGLSCTATLSLAVALSFTFV